MLSNSHIVLHFLISIICYQIGCLSGKITDAVKLAVCAYAIEIGLECLGRRNDAHL